MFPFCVCNSSVRITELAICSDFEDKGLREKCCISKVIAKEEMTLNGFKCFVLNNNGFGTLMLRPFSLLKTNCFG